MLFASSAFDDAKRVIVLFGKKTEWKYNRVKSALLTKVNR